MRRLQNLPVVKLLVSTFLRRRDHAALITFLRRYTVDVETQVVHLASLR